MGSVDESVTTRNTRAGEGGVFIESRQGMALMAALLIIVLIGALVVGAFAMSTQESRISRNMLRQERALAAAEHGMNNAMQGWTLSNAKTMSVGDVQTKIDTTAGGAIDTVRITRLNTTTFWLVSTGTAGSTTLLRARRRSGVILRLDIPQVKVLGAVTTRLTSKLTLSGTANFSGNDVNPPGWGCDSTGPALPGMAAPDTNSTNYGSSSSVPNTGSPPVLETSLAADTALYSQFGGITYDSLTAHANKVYAAGANGSSIAPSLTGAACNTADPKNWGEPWRAPTVGTVTQCNDFYPIIWAQGNFQFSGGRGQGILLVDGNFTASGGTEFKGLIITKGSFTTSGGGIKLQGALLARGSATNGAMSGSTAIQFSRCALETVLMNSAIAVYPKPVRRRSWADMF